MSRKVLADIAERTVATFVFAFLSAYNFTDLSDWRSAAVAAGAASATFLKSAIMNLIDK